VQFIHKPFTPAQIREVIRRSREDSAGLSSRRVLQEVGWEVFESLGGLTVRPGLDQPCTQPLDVRAQVKFSGHFSGVLFVDVTESLLLLLANNMLGLELGFPSAERQQDCFGELSNVLCANLLTRLAGSKPVFDLEAPQILPGPFNTDDPEPSRRRAAALLQIEEGWARLTLTLDQPASENNPT